MELLAPAKINLSLRVLHRRPDNFHEIETCIASISLCDTLDLAKREKGIDFTCDDPSVPSGDDNLAVRAARIFFAATKMKGGVSIKLQKKIPHGAGLGGGSSDAATTLLGLNEMFGTKLSREELIDLAAQLGSDVPFFIYRSAAVCRGRGETVTPAKLTGHLPLLLLKPKFSVPTPWAYSRWMNSREFPQISYAPQKFADTEFVNDLERPVFEKFVFLATLKRWLQQQWEVGAALLSGSGSTIFAVLKNAADSEELAKRARAELDPELRTYLCETLEGAAPSAP